MDSNNGISESIHIDATISEVVISAYLIVTFIGWFGNTNVIIATVRNRALQNPCNILIAIQSFCELFHQAAHAITAYFIYTGNYFITVKPCLYLQFVSNIFMQFASFLVLSIGVDRIFCVSFAIRFLAEFLRAVHYLHPSIFMI
ncbi:unnamed protein product [Toxocara canis]|uniref:G_PROTEIN_RECEP_F1_2 domain-containing protein n=1 Tax=Toxocara canis TaxID=6265 RepID=A0A183U5U7_TOXCA|nr:unnamed protein product [Toxocara canis]